MKCTDCGNNVAYKRIVRAEPELPGIVVDGLEEGTCEGCGLVYKSIPRLRELHELKVRTIVGKRWRFAPDEVRWARRSMNLKADELAAALGVTASQVSRWETGAAPVSALADRLIRLVVANFHRVEAPELAGIDGSHGEPLEVRIVLSERWEAVEPAKQKRKSSAEPAKPRRKARDAA